VKHSVSNCLLPSFGTLMENVVHETVLVRQEGAVVVVTGGGVVVAPLEVLEVHGA
jgi:hypothetical protein